MRMEMAKKSTQQKSCGIFCPLIFLVALAKQSEAFRMTVGARQQIAFRGRIASHQQLNQGGFGIGEEEDAFSYVDALLSVNHEKSADAAPVSQQKKAILQTICNLHAADYATAEASPIALEEHYDNPREIQYGWIPNHVAVESLEPLLTHGELQSIRNAAGAIWERLSGESSSRFTYQYEGNSEAHVSDFVQVGQVGQEALAAVNQCLTGKVYPWLRNVFFSGSSDPAPTQLFVYDALVIRYNATAAATSTAGQPLHRDLGLLSVNIMLNEGFVGGGTFFENQATDKPLKPSGGPGHALAHYSYERHAGAGTAQGVRDILVCFISARDRLPRLLNARLKQTRDRCGSMQDPLQAILCRMLHQRLAIEAVPEDGEAFQYLGTSLLDYSKYLEATGADAQDLDGTEALLQAIHCFRHAQRLTPGDARVYNNWSIALGRLEGRNKLHIAPAAADDLTNPRQVYQRGLDLLRQAERAGCLVGKDLDSLSLNFSLYLANHDLFMEACEVLENTASKFDDSCENSRVLSDANRLWNFCRQQAVR